MGTRDGQRLARDHAFPQLKEAAIGLTGMNYWADKDAALADNLAGLLSQRALAPAQLVARLRAENGHGPETEALIDRVTVGETFFFRHPDQFRVLAHHILPQRLAAGAAPNLWSAGCSIGAEAYSLSILLHRDLGLAMAGRHPRVVGTDISAGAVAQARSALFGAWSLRGLSPQVMDQCFERVDGMWRVREAYRRGVSFAMHNLASDPPPMVPGGFDAILCRNVLMYFDGPTRRRVLENLAQGLAADGVLVVAPAEVGPDMTLMFEAVSLNGCTFYRLAPPPPRYQPEPDPGPADSEVGPAEPWLVKALLDRGAFAEAADLARHWVERAPLDPQAHYHLGLALEPAEPAAAALAFLRAVGLQPPFAMAHFHLLRLAARRGDTGAALSHFRAVQAALACLPVQAPVPAADGMPVSHLLDLARRLAGGR